jgi:hypothetical protein
LVNILVISSITSGDAEYVIFDFDCEYGLEIGFMFLKSYLPCGNKMKYIGGENEGKKFFTKLGTQMLRPRFWQRLGQRR